MEKRKSSFRLNQTKLQDKVKVRDQQIKIRDKVLKIRVTVNVRVKAKVRAKVKGMVKVVFKVNDKKEHFRNQGVLVVDVVISMVGILVRLKVRFAESVVVQTISQNVVVLPSVKKFTRYTIWRSVMIIWLML